MRKRGWCRFHGGLRGKGDKTLVVLHELYPSKQAPDDAIASRSASGAGEQFEQLDTILVAMVRS
jgi:hypothetical protein